MTCLQSVEPFLLPLPTHAHTHTHTHTIFVATMNSNSDVSVHGVLKNMLCVLSGIMAFLMHLER